MSTTKTAKHTPGPWKNDGPTRQGGVRIVAPYKPTCTYMVAEVLPDCPDDATRDANARLIAAAPDLLAALEKVLAAYEAAREPGHGTILIDEARDAIAKARGGA